MKEFVRVGERVRETETGGTRDSHLRRAIRLMNSKREELCCWVIC